MDPIEPVKPPESKGTDLSALRTRLAKVLGRDRPVLRRRIDQLAAAKATADTTRQTALLAAIEASVVKRQARASAVPTGKAQSIRWDTAVTGLGLRCYASGSNIWICRYRPAGRGREIDREPSGPQRQNRHRIVRPCVDFAVPTK